MALLDHDRLSDSICWLDTVVGGELLLWINMVGARESTTGGIFYGRTKMIVVTSSVVNKGDDDNFIGGEHEWTKLMWVIAVTSSMVRKASRGDKKCWVFKWCGQKPYLAHSLLMEHFQLAFKLLMVWYRWEIFHQLYLAIRLGKQVYAMPCKEVVGNKFAAWDA